MKEGLVVEGGEGQWGRENALGGFACHRWDTMQCQSPSTKWMRWMEEGGLPVDEYLNTWHVIITRRINTFSLMMHDVIHVNGA
jgi:hypothetical protein